MADNNSDKNDLEWRLGIENQITDIAKNRIDIDKAISDIKLNSKHILWYEVSKILIAIGLGIALVKLFS